MAKAASDREGCYRLRRPASRVEWAAYHGIRQAVALGGEGNDADELAPTNFPLLLWLEDCPVGTVQIDMLDGGAAAFRLVAVDPSHQGRGHGLVLLREAEAFARESGCRKAVVYSTQEAVGFYVSAGYAEDDWDDQSFGGIVQMTKPLAYAGFGMEEA